MEFIKMPTAGLLQKVIESKSQPEQLFIVGDQQSMDFINDFLSEHKRPAPEKVREAAAQINAAELLVTRKEEYLHEYISDDGYNLDDMIGDWPDEEFANNNSALLYNVHDDEMLSEVYVMKLHCENSYDVFAHTNYGGWNEVPNSPEQYAIWKYWNKKFGAEVISLGSDIIEGYVPKPINDREKALALAWEFYAYCPECVDQGAGSISNVAGYSNLSNIWFFWWD